LVYDPENTHRLEAIIKTNEDIYKAIYVDLIKVHYQIINFIYAQELIQTIKPKDLTKIETQDIIIDPKEEITEEEIKEEEIKVEKTPFIKSIDKRGSMIIDNILKRNDNKDVRDVKQKVEIYDKKVKDNNPNNINISKRNKSGSTIKINLFVKSTSNAINISFKDVFESSKLDILDNYTHVVLTYINPYFSLEGIYYNKEQLNEIFDYYFSNCIEDII